MNISLQGLQMLKNSQIFSLKNFSFALTLLRVVGQGISNFISHFLLIINVEIITG